MKRTYRCAGKIDDEVSRFQVVCLISRDFVRLISALAGQLVRIGEANLRYLSRVNSNCESFCNPDIRAKSLRSISTFFALNCKMVGSCDHRSLCFSTSSYAATTTYQQPDLHTRKAAATTKVVRRSVEIEDYDDSTFPAPLVLPEDDLSYDPLDPAQSMRSWTREKHRNKVTPKRRTVYFTGPPKIEAGLGYIKEWSLPRVKVSGKETAIDFPKTEEVLAYLQAFYCGLPVKMLPLPKISYTRDVDDAPEPGIHPKTMGKQNSNNTQITKSPTLWLNTQSPSGCVGIRTRATPEGSYSHQLNLNDLLDAAIDMLPNDAYALLMLVDHDIYEDDDDDFAVSNSQYFSISSNSLGLVRQSVWRIPHRCGVWSKV